jgi:type IV secretion system protein VirB8
VTDELTSYFQEATTWDRDRAAQTVQRARIAWIVAAGGWISAIATAIALIVLMPLKSVEPYVIRVDSSTGIVDVVPMYAGRAGIVETVARYLITHYVTLCEGFSYPSAERDYEECGAFHTAKRNQEWFALWTQANPLSPLNQYKDGTAVRVQVTAVSFFQTNNTLTSMAQVRYIKAIRAPGGSERLSHWIATLEYAYGTPSHDPRTRQWNPLGFRITDFRTEAETLPEPTP